jgi:hypothetical protein
MLEWAALGLRVRGKRKLTGIFVFFLSSSMFANKKTISLFFHTLLNILIKHLPWFWWCCCIKLVDINSDCVCVLLMLLLPCFRYFYLNIKTKFFQSIRAKNC